ncbi:NAD-dependent epimerase/dehydratase family protein [Leptospira noguchii]|uniref:3-beta hydroxysteroid dehydrogenase/isomerase family protein n=1 Tax=Leptospira noguchii serovar Autumnalis str. ZUN142 TaxID=1085540 RepID=M6V0U4_9LEPT|nr:NAD-dependent epimerase/dehydratase family protein [Leptospira noguchii]EMO43178.1 3-beta hydroxysteroid dehydrogenase/isomerase family protein [Leptospira noguchii serovar Autumnalis str. ZUN142]EMS88517.1 3-beta hydroxysteroid dehydrogenase/isomerase family protein [Leptospira noguchii str. Hook]UOG47581.1 NAD-dependent epimerase/dehydratase family protein [Leptospira noguchii]
MKILVTGAAGFIGFHLAQELIEGNDEIIGLDNLNNYYDVNLKVNRLNILKKFTNFQFQNLDIIDFEKLNRLFQKEKFDVILHLAAQAGVRYSSINPHVYSQSNLVGFVNILEASKLNNISHLIYASSSSVYGGNTKIPFSEIDPVDHPVSLYAATKRSNELMAHCYSHLYGLPVTGLRFFTVYGAWGRPDMAPHLFTNAILSEKPIKVFNYGNLERDFTFVGDIKKKIKLILLSIPTPKKNDELLNPSNSWAPFQIFNFGNKKPTKVTEFISILESLLGKKAILQMEEMQPGDIALTCADTQIIEKKIQYETSTPLNVGLKQFVDWYKNYYRV